MLWGDGLGLAQISARRHHARLATGKGLGASATRSGCLAEGLGMRATARVFEVDPNTALPWLVEAAEQLQAFSRYCLCDVHVRQVQLDALYALLSAGKGGALSEDSLLEEVFKWSAMVSLAW